MPRLSAIDAISPAMERTKAMLTRPFQFRKWMLMGFIAWLAGEAGTASFNFNFPGFPHTPGKGGPSTPGGPFPHIPWTTIALLIAAFVLLALLVGLVFLYVSSRFRFVLFDTVISREIGVETGWKRYRDAAHRYFWLWLVAGIIVFLVLAAVIGIPLWFFIKRNFLGQGGPSIESLFSLIGIAFLVFLVLGLGGYVLTTLVKDFMVPLMALDDLPAGRAWSELKRILKAEPGSFAGYLGMKLLLSIAAAVGVSIIMIPVMMIFLFIGIFIGVAGYVTIQGAAPALIVTLIVAAVLGLLLFSAVMIGLSIFLSAPVAVFFTSYALYFFGGRYPHLDELLWPQQPGPPPPPSAKILVPTA